MSLQKIFSDSARDFYKNPSIAIPPLVLSVIVFFLSYFYQKIIKFVPAGKLIPGTTITTNGLISLVSFRLIIIIFISFFLVGLIGMSSNLVKGKKNNFKEYFYYSRKFFLKNFIIILTFVIGGWIISAIAFYIAFEVGKILNLSLVLAQLLFLTIYIIGLLGFLIFLALSSFYLVIENTSIINSIKSSIRNVKINYLSILTIFVISFVLFRILAYISNSINPWIADILGILILTPLLSLILTRVVLNKT